jgi:tight adherence protein B
VSLRTWAAGRGGGESLLVADALVLGHTLGGGSAEVVEGVAGALRERLDLRREARAQAGPARLSMALVAALPLVFLTIVGGADPRLLSFLTSSPLGLACLAAGVGLDAAAFLAAEVLTRRALP